MNVIKEDISNPEYMLNMRTKVSQKLMSMIK